jgi:hypothetical protein
MSPDNDHAGDGMSEATVMPGNRPPSQLAEATANGLQTHEAVCAERYANLLNLLESTTRRVGRLEVLIVIVAGSVICGMGGIIFTLALKLGTH